MKKRTILLGILAGALSLNSCVKDTESDSVSKQRQAQTEKTKAEAAVAMAQAKVKEAEAALAQANAAYTEASNKIELKIKEAEANATITKHEKVLEEAKVELENAKNKAQYDLDKAAQDLKVDIDDLTAEVAAYAGVHQAKVAKEVQDRLGDYEDGLNTLNGKRVALIGKENNLTRVKFGLVSVENAKADVIAGYELDIKIAEATIKALEKYANYNGNLDKLRLDTKLKEVELKSKKEVAENAFKGVSAYTKNDGKYAKAEEKAAKELEKITEAADLINGNVAGTVEVPQIKSSKEVEVAAPGKSPENFTYKLYPSSTSSFIKDEELIKDEIKNKEEDLKPLKDAVADAKNAEKEAKAKENLAKVKYEADRTDANRDAWKAAKANTKTKAEAVASAQENLDKATEKVSEFKEAYAFIKGNKAAEALKEAKKVGEEAVKVIEAYNKGAYKSYSDVQKEVGAMKTALGGSEAVDEAIADQKEIIHNSQLSIKTYSAVQTKEEAVWLAEQEVEVAKLAITAQEEVVKILKYNYEEALERFKKLKG